ncbi:hypothetical protein AWC38_SpisGene10933 [Stylophora pistillata]|uniref:PKD/REJ-like domain-containing protein n=1 Tax=Stylophora pistillata TaxID=50429 RepID=A0A2B4S7D4_STYPI|nr:hypothetical protein AWC38_SpisGene10933 [Stylophora pistillata]
MKSTLRFSAGPKSHSSLICKSVTNAYLLSASSFTSTTSPDSTSVISPTATATVVASSTARIVYAPPPQVTSVKFSKTATKILIQFNVEVQFVSAEETCDEFFNNATVTTLGGYAECSLGHTKEVEIILGEGATINVGDPIEFKADVFKAHNEENGRFLNGSSSVDSPDVHLKPVPIIKGPNVLSSCGNLSLSGSQSFGSGGRPLIFKWSLISPNAGSNVTAITDILSNLSSNSDRVEIPGSLVESNETYLFKLEVANFLNTSEFEETTHSVIKVSDPVPALTLSSSIDLSEGKMFVSEEFHIRATVIVAPCASDARVQTSWAVTCSDPSAKDKVESSDGFRATKNQNTLKISKGVFTSDVNCTFTVTASMKYDPSVKTSISQDIKALPSPLEAAILGGDRLIGRNSGAIKLDAKTLTIDPDGTNHELSCSWSCAVLGGGLCNPTVDNDFILSTANGCITEVQSNHFFAGKTYVISVDVTKGSRSAAASIELTVVEGEPPAVWVDVANIKMNPNDRLTLQGYYKTNTEPTKVEWSCSEEQGFSFVELSGYNPVTSFKPGNNSFVLLTLPLNLLKPDSKYRFKLTINEGNEEGEASLAVHVRAGPTAGPSAGLSVSPISVQALNVVTLSASGWVTDQDAYPIRYSFGLLVEKDVCEAFGLPSNDLEREQIVPQGSGSDYILSLCVVVLDKFNSFAIRTFNITSSPPSSDDLTPDALESLLQSTVDNPLQSGNVDGALGAVMSIVDTVQTSNETTDEVKTNISRRTEEVVLDIVESTVIDQDLAFPLLTVLVKTNITASENSSRTANAALKILQKLDDKPLSDDLAGDFYTWVADLADDSIDNNDGLKETVGNALEKFADNIGTELKCGDPPREVSDDRLGSVKVQVAELKEEIVSSSRPGAPRFDPGPQLSKEYSGTRECGGGKLCCGVFLKMIRYEKNLIVADESKQTDDSQVVSSQIIGVDLRDPITKTPLVIQSLVHPLKLFFFIPSVPKEKKLGCVYFDEDKMVWLKTGLKAVGPVSSNFTCESTHATYFAPSHDSVLTKEQSSTDATGAIVGLVMGLLMGLLAVLLVILFILWKKHQKVTTELPQLEHRL